jgi:hypothetical protein
MTMKSKVPTVLLGLVAIAIWLAACQVTREAECTLPSGTDVGQAFDHAGEELSRKACKSLFDDYFERLLDIAAGAPDLQHSRRFSEFLLWADDREIITRSSAENYYNRYFSPKFASLPDEQNNCTHTCRVQAEVGRDMQQELLQKDMGLLKVTNDPRKYALANSNYYSILTLIEATCEACRAAP